MAGSSNITGDESIIFCDNMSFDGTERGGKMTTNGQLWIGSTLTRHVKLGSIISPGGTITIGYSSPNITIDLAGGAAAIERIAVQTGVSPILPSGGTITFNGSVVAAGTNPVRTDGTGANTLALEVQTSQALVAADATKIGLSNFDSSSFAVAATGFVTLSTTGAGKTITGDSGGALSPTANNWNIVGGFAILTAGSGSTLTINHSGSTNIAAYNLGINYSSPTFSVVQGNGSALSSTNPGYIILNSFVTPGTLIKYTIAANQTFTDGSGGTTATQRFGLPVSVNWAQDIPFFLYAVSNSKAGSPETTIAFMISRNPSAVISPAAAGIGKSGAVVNVDDSDFFSLANITVADYAASPCVNIGSFRMRFTGASNSWTVQTLNPLYDGIGVLNASHSYVLPVAVQGAATGSYFLANGGTAPIWTNQQITYQLSKTGEVVVNVDLENISTNGVGAVTALMTLPYIAKTLNAPLVGSVNLFNSGTSVYVTGVPLTQAVAHPYTPFIFSGNAGNTNLVTFGALTNFLGAFRYYPWPVA